MASAAEIGATSSYYRGDPGLGGFGLGFGKIDTRPLDDLARYTYFYNQAEYNQRQKDVEARAKELAAATDYDLTTSIPKDAKILREKYDALINYIKDNPEAVDYKNTDKWIEYKRMRNELKNNITSAGVRNLTNMLRQNEIDDTTAPELKGYLQEQLNKEIDATDINTPLRHTAKFDIAPVPIDAAPIRKFAVTDVGRNVIGTAEWNMVDQKALVAMANTGATGLANLTDFQNTASFKALPPQLQQLYFDQYKAQAASGKLLPVKQAENFNAAIQSSPDLWTEAPGGKKVVNMEAVTNSSNGLVRGVGQSIQQYNDYVDQMVKYIKGGYFKDNFGNELHFGNDASGLQESDFKKIDLTDGLQPDEVLKMQIYAKSQQQPNREIKILQTDNEIQRENVALRRQELGLQREKFDYSKSGSFLGADSVMKEVADVINSGQPFIRTHNGKTEKVRVISDPNAIKEFATIDKDGKTTNPADDIVYNPQTNGITLMYYKRPEMEKQFTANEYGARVWNGSYTVKPGQNVGPDGFLLNSKGERIVADEKPLNARQWMGQIVNRKFAADDKGNINNLVNEIYDKVGKGNLLKLAEKYRGTPPQTDQAQTQETERASGSSTQQTSIPEFSRAEWKASGWTDEMISRGIKEGRIKVTD